MAGLRVVAAWKQVGGVAHRGRARLFTHSVTLLWSEVLYTFLYRWHPQKLKVTGVLLRIGAQAPLGSLAMDLIWPLWPCLDLLVRYLQAEGMPLEHERNTW